MKSKRNILIGTLFGILIGWILALSRIPILLDHTSLLVGAIATLLLISAARMLSLLWNKMKGKTPSSSMNGILISALVLIGGLTCWYLIQRQNKQAEHQARYQTMRLEQQAAEIAAEKNRGLMEMMGGILEKIEAEKQAHPDGRLSNETIERVVALSQGLKPYKYLLGDSLSSRALSPERGQLLLALINIKMDSVSLDSIKARATFEAADLEGANLSGANLKGIDLQKANLKEADLGGANLRQADLRKAILWGANMWRIDGGWVDMKRADMQWVVLDGAHLDSADLSGANLASAKIRVASLIGVALTWGSLNDALLQGTDLDSVNLRGTTMIRTNFTQTNLRKASFIQTDLTEANFTKANLAEANLTRVNWTDAELTEAILTEAFVDQDLWLDRLEEWRVTGAKELQDSYQLLKDSTQQNIWFIQPNQ